jgi:hypothetical protein
MSTFREDLKISDERMAEVAPKIRAFAAQWKRAGQDRAAWKATRPKFVAQHRREGYTAGQTSFVMSLIEQEMVRQQVRGF